MTGQSDREKILIEKLAAIEHQRWAGWHEHAARNWTQANVLRWNALANMSYEDELTEDLKQKDRDEVMRYWPLIEEALHEERERAKFECEVECVKKYVNAERLIEWMDNPERKPAIHAFTKGSERQIAYRFEMEIRRAIQACAEICRSAEIKFEMDGKPMVQKIAAQDVVPDLLRLKEKWTSK